MQGHRSRSRVRFMVEPRLTAVLLSRDQLRVAWRGVRRGAAEDSASGGVQRVWACERSNTVGLTSILDQGQFF